MSYEIYYCRAFIKLPGLPPEQTLFVPVIQAGSNNCFDVSPKTGRLISEKSWFNWCWMPKQPGNCGPLFCTEEHIRAYAEVFSGRWTTDAELPHYARHSCFKTKEAAERWFLNGTRNAQTVETYHQWGNAPCVINSSLQFPDNLVEVTTTLELLKAVEHIGNLRLVSVAFRNRDFRWGRK